MPIKTEGSMFRLRHKFYRKPFLTPSFTLDVLLIWEKEPQTLFSTVNSIKLGCNCNWVSCGCDAANLIKLSSRTCFSNSFKYFPHGYACIRRSQLEVFLGKVVLKIYNKFTGKHQCRSVISVELQSNFTEIALRHGCSPVNLLHIFRTSFIKNTSEWLLLMYV